MTSYYEILNISPYASDHEVKAAYRKLAMQFHPDKNPHNRRFYDLRFRLINEAYTHLKTRERRMKYDQMLRLRAGNDNQGQPSLFSRMAALFRPSEDKQRHASS